MPPHYNLIRGNWAGTESSPYDFRFSKSTMKRLEALCHAVLKLEIVVGEPAARWQEAEVLLQHCLGINKVQLYMEPGTELKPEEESRFSQYLNRRMHLEPAPYISGRTEFFGLEFFVDSSVLIPRPESELLVEKVLKHIRDKDGNSQVSLLIADIGTGSGCLVIALSMSLPHCKALAIDISRESLKIARRNVLRHNVHSQIELIQGDLLSALEIPKLDIIVANLPYISFGEYEKLSGDGLKYEPTIALLGGSDGLFYIKSLLAQASEKLNQGSCLFLEAGAGQAPVVAEMARKYFVGAQVEIFRDLGGVERVVKVYLSE